jgi:transcriptional repressor NrdR
VTHAHHLADRANLSTAAAADHGPRRRSVDAHVDSPEDTTARRHSASDPRILGGEDARVICPYCGEDHDKVIDSRSTDAGEAIRRRRECLECSKRFTTYERVEKTHRLVVVKKDGSRVPFNAENLLKGVQAACGKRPIPEDLKAGLVHDVEEELHREFDREVDSVEIGRRVAARLREIDGIAYIRYASEYYDFRTLDEFAAELSDLQARPPNLPNQRDLFASES